MKSFFLKLIILSLLLTSCESEKDSFESFSVNDKYLLKSLPVYDFDWETVDWMPTPNGQSLIAPPWIGQGSITSSFGLDVANDYKKTDGWVLLYNTFNPNTTGKIENPYFILYNKYTGILRCYMYMTTQFAYTSSYLQDGISLQTKESLGLLNFLGTNWWQPLKKDVSTNKVTFQQIQPTPLDGSKPLSSNRWYMQQYEIQYDPKVTTMDAEGSKFSINMNYVNITEYNFGGSIKGDIQGSIGTSSSSSGIGNIISNLSKAGSAKGFGSIDFIGSILDISGGNVPTSIIPESTSKTIKESIKGIKGGSHNDIVKSSKSLFDALFKSKSSKATPIKLKVDLKIEMKGTSTESGAVPGGNMTFYIPGTKNMDKVQNMIPLYNKPLGIISYTDMPIQTINIDYYDGNIGSIDIKNIPNVNISNYISFNPETKKEADISISKQELILFAQRGGLTEIQDQKWDQKILCDKKELVGNFKITNSDIQNSEKACDQYCYINPKLQSLNDLMIRYPRAYKIEEDLIWALRCYISIKPKNKISEYTLIKTFRIPVTYKLKFY